MLSHEIIKAFEEDGTICNHKEVDDYLLTKNANSRRIFIYEIIGSVPKGYFIRNIGKQNMPEGYLPLVEKDEPENPNCRTSNINTLKVIRCKESYNVLDILEYYDDTGTLQGLKKTLTKVQKNKQNPRWCTRANKALPILEKIKWD